MQRLLVISFSAAVGTGFYYWFSRMIHKESMQEFINSHLWLLHPNAICYWRTAMALIGFVLYFFSGYQSFAIIIFTFAAISTGLTGSSRDSAIWARNGVSGWIHCVTS